MTVHGGFLLALFLTGFRTYVNWSSPVKNSRDEMTLFFGDKGFSHRKSRQYHADNSVVITLIMVLLDIYLDY